MATDRSDLTGNRSNGNSGDGFLIGGRRNGLVLNKAPSNGGSGIHVSFGSVNNDIIRNITAGNTVFDVQNDNATCVNHWEINTFITSHGPCIR